MKLFTCSECRSVVFFENVRCTTCAHALAYLPELGVMTALAPLPASDATRATYTALAPAANGAHVRLCGNHVDYAVCNWAIPAASADTLCRACRCNHTIPNLSDPAAIDSWRRLEIAKRRLIYTLLALELPVEAKSEASPRGVAFAFEQDQPSGKKVVTGHCDGLITINVAEADAPFREHVRIEMHETYRTLLGHFRHEIGHYYWARLIDGTAELDAFRERFGDERASYDDAAKHHYDVGPPADWATRFVSAYASMHPWEDWAETWAHYLHMVDTLDTARSYGLALRPTPVGGATISAVVARRLDFDDFSDLVAAWVPLTLALNSLNRSMGLPDLYAFVLSEAAIAKLRFVHDAIDRASLSRARASAGD